jgi:hypothetical protein
MVRALSNVERVSAGILEASARCRERAAAALADGLIIQSELDEAIKQVDEQSKARAAWWLTGKARPS